MRHSAISEEEVDFQEHYVGYFWLVYSHGPWPNRLAGAYETPLCYSVWILCPQTKLATCPMGVFYFINVHIGKNAHVHYFKLCLGSIIGRLSSFLEGFEAKWKRKHACF
jgi:hypothetical protein